ncbi:LanC-like protein [Caenimonas sp. SL110]|uniref:lanthionine synthetase C family protein n=1 Tax=Caenimonas sp. SL110 TaxID=1450524 RepID=UPI00069DAE2D|nr:LanC-like protein [Caenimonas sp. SL110]
MSNAFPSPGGDHSMMFDPGRHQPLSETAWNEQAARDAIACIVQGAEAGFREGQGWPVHPLDNKKPDPMYGLYIGDCGVIWALKYLERRKAAKLTRDWLAHLAQLQVTDEHGSYMFGETPIRLMLAGSDERLAELIVSTMRHPARELMWGAPGTMLAALFLYRRTSDARWALLYRQTADVLWSQLEWSQQEQCHFWTQDLYGRQSTYLDAVHGFAATASVLINGRDLLGADEWQQWSQCIVRTVRATAEVEGNMANWRAQLQSPRGATKLVQFCHGAPGFVICLAGMPGPELDDLLIAAGETTWRAGPLSKGSNLCHGTGGNGYAFLKLYQRLGDPLWLERARAFAMHGIAQTMADRATHDQWRHGLWTGDVGFAIYLLDCIEATSAFPSLDVFD